MEASTIAACKAVEIAIRTLKLPKHIELQSEIWITHTSLNKATHQIFEEVDPTQIKDYERLEVSSRLILLYSCEEE